ncbi:MAG: inorganic phosphate transporter [Clostridia bacterium]|nr:inorganic phosphate transporter [Clostridia bacterium]
MTVYTAVIFALALAFTFYMGYFDGANAVATCIVSRSLKPYTALIVAAIVKFAAPLLLCYLIGSYSVAQTVAGVIDGGALLTLPSRTVGFIFLLSTMIAVLGWLTLSLFLNVPNSTSHTLLGGLVGAAMVTFGASSVDWMQVGIKVILMVFLAPVLCMAFGFILQKLMLKLSVWLTRDAAGVVKGAQVVNMTVLSGAVSMNNTQKGLGVYLLSCVLLTDGATSVAEASKELNVWVMIGFCLAIMLGLLLGGFRLISTIGSKIYRLNLMQAYVSSTSSMIVSVVTNVTGIPVSTGQITSSSIIGVGMASKARNVKWKRVFKIFSSWLLTFPAACALGAGICALLNAIIAGGLF